MGFVVVWYWNFGTASVKRLLFQSPVLSYSPPPPTPQGTTFEKLLRYLRESPCAWTKIHLRCPSGRGGEGTLCRPVAGSGGFSRASESCPLSERRMCSLAHAPPSNFCLASIGVWRVLAVPRGARCPCGPQWARGARCPCGPQWARGAWMLRMEALRVGESSPQATGTGLCASADKSPKSG